MAYETPIADDLALYLGTTVDSDRAALIIGIAENSLGAAILPLSLPDGAEGLVTQVAARVYGNPQALSTEGTGPYSVVRPVGLTKQERRQIRKLAGLSGAFTIDPTPATAGPGNLWAQQPETLSEMTSQPPFYGDFDQNP